MRHRLTFKGLTVNDIISLGVSHVAAYKIINGQYDFFKVRSRKVAHKIANRLGIHVSELFNDL